MGDSTYTVERSATIEAQPEQIYEQIVNFRTWMAWSPWEGLDPELQRSYSGADSGTGAVYGWSGNRKAGRGRMEITDVIEPQRVMIDIVFEKPWKAHNDIVFSIQPEGSGSRVTWSITGKKTFMTKVMCMFTSMDKLVGPDFERGLARLKTITEKPATN